MIKKYFGGFEKWFLIITLAFSSCLILLQIILRSVFNNGLSWSEELSRFLFLWQTWIGIAYATCRWNHLRVTFLRDLANNKVKEVWEMFVIIWWFAFGLFLIVKGGQFTLMVAAKNQRSTALRIPMAFVYASIPVGGFLMDLHLIDKAISNIKNWGHNFETKEEHLEI